MSLGSWGLAASSGLSLLVVWPAAWTPPSDYYPLAKGAEWTYSSDLNGSVNSVIITNEGLVPKGQRQLYSQTARVEGQVVETKFVEVDARGAYLAGTQKPSDKPYYFVTPRPLVFFADTSAEQTEWNGSSEEAFLCPPPSTGKLRVELEGQDQIVSRGATVLAVRVRTSGTVDETCPKSPRPLSIGYDNISWFVAGVGLVRSAVTIQIGSMSRRFTSELKHYKPARAVSIHESWRLPLDTPRVGGRFENAAQ